MALETERRFLVDPEILPKIVSQSTGIRSLTQGYLENGEANSPTVRVRADSNNIDGDAGWVTIKISVSKGISEEYEYKISYANAMAMLTECKSLISKKRFEILIDGHKWEFDVFSGLLEGLIIAEIELPSLDTKYPIPDFATSVNMVEITGDKRFSNRNMVRSSAKDIAAVVKSLTSW